MRVQLVSRRIELNRGKLYRTEEERLTTLVLLLENVGADAVVRIGRPDVWRVMVDLTDPLPTFVSTGLTKIRASELTVSIRHALRVATFPIRQSDSFDRLIVALAGVEPVTLDSADAKLVPYGVPIIW